MQSLREVEREHVKKALDETNGNKTHAAFLLKISRATLYRMIKRFGLVIVSRS